MKTFIIGLFVGVILNAACSMGSKKPEFTERKENLKLWEFKSIEKVTDQNGREIVVANLYNKTCTKRKSISEKCAKENWKETTKNICDPDNFNNFNFFKNAGYKVVPEYILRL